MMRVNTDSLEFLDDNGLPIAKVSLDQLKLSLHPTDLLLWACVWQLVELNARLGSFDPQQKKGSGVMGGLAQLSFNAAHTGQEVTAIRALLEKLASATPHSQADVQGLVQEALAAFRGIPGFPSEAASPTPTEPIVTQPAAAAAAAAQADEGQEG